MKGLFSTLVFVFFLTLEGSAQQKWTLHSEVIDDIIYCAIEPKTWINDLQSLEIEKYSLVGGEWIKNGDNSISIGIKSSRSLTNNNCTEDVFNNSKIDSLIASGALQAASLDKINTVGSKSNWFLKSFLFQSIDYIMYSGFGFSECIDEESESVRYKVYAVNAEKSKNLVADSVFTTQNTIYKVSSIADFQFNSFKDLILTIKSKIESPTGHKGSFLGFKLVKMVEGNETVTVPLIPVSRSDSSIIQQVEINTEELSKSDPTGFYLSHGTLFGYQGEPYYFEYDPSLYFTDLEVPPVNVAYVDDDLFARREKGMFVTWDIDPKYNEQIESLTLTCKERFKSEDTIYSVQLPVESRSFVDTLAIPDNSYKDYAYLLTVDFVNEIETQTSYQDFRFDAPLPPKPKNPDDQPGNLQYEVFKDGSLYKVRFTWDDPVNYPVSGYRLVVAYDEYDGLGVASDVPLIEGNEYIFTPYNNLGQNMKFAFKPIRTDGSEGVLSEVLSFPTPSSSIYHMDLFDVEIENLGDRARLTWKQYSPEVKDLKSIEVLKDGQVIAELDKTATEWTSDFLPAGKHEYEVRAVTLYGLISGATLKKKVVIE